MSSGLNSSLSYEDEDDRPLAIDTDESGKKRQSDKRTKLGKQLTQRDRILVPSFHLTPLELCGKLKKTLSPLEAHSPASIKSSRTQVTSHQWRTMTLTPLTALTDEWWDLCSRIRNRGMSRSQKRLSALTATVSTGSTTSTNIWSLSIRE